MIIQSICSFYSLYISVYGKTIEITGNVDSIGGFASNQLNSDRLPTAGADIEDI